VIWRFFRRAEPEKRINLFSVPAVSLPRGSLSYFCFFGASGVIAMGRPVYGTHPPLPRNSHCAQ
jgi:hypothetical protein